MPTIDICLAPSAMHAGAAVLLTVTDELAARRIVDAINDAPRFQGEHLTCFAVPVVRDAEVADTRTPTSAAPVADEGHED